MPNNRLTPPLMLTPPPLGNPGSAIAEDIYILFCALKYFDHFLSSSWWILSHIFCIRILILEFFSLISQEFGAGAADFLLGYQYGVCTRHQSKRIEPPRTIQWRIHFGGPIFPQNSTNSPPPKKHFSLAAAPSPNLAVNATSFLSLASRNSVIAKNEWYFLHGRNFMTILNISGGSRISRGRQPQVGVSLLIDIMCTENCTKMKQIELRRAAGSATES